MGVPGLLRKILETYDKSHRAIGKHEFYDNFFIDFNALIYNAYYSLDREKLAKMNTGKIEAAIIAKIIVNLKEMINTLISPTKICYIAVDGSAPRAKMLRQRERRYKKIFKNKFDDQLRKRYPEVPREVWDTSRASPGTEFMDKLDKALKKAIVDGEFQKHPKAGDLKIYFNGNYVPGEAEHKYMKMVGEVSGRTCIFSNDGDMLMLGGRYPDKNIDIMVNIVGTGALEKIYLKPGNNRNGPKFAAIDLTYVDKGIHENLAPKRDCTRVVHDYTLYSMMGENDFVHPFPFTHVRDRGVPELFAKIYRKLLDKHDDYLVRYTAEGSAPSINIPFLTDFIGELGSIEQESMQEKQKMYQNPNLSKRDLDRQLQMKEDGVPEWKIIQNNFQHVPVYKKANPLYGKYHKQFKKINYFQPEAKWKEEYYQTFFHLKGPYEKMKPQIKKICIEWVKSLTFALVYYLDELPSWTYFYPYEVAPMPSDVKTTLLEVSNMNKQVSFDLGKPFTPLQQQMLILPPQNEILPKAYTDLMKKEPLKPYYPETFELNFLAGGKYIYSEPVLPDIPADLVIKETEKVRKKLDKANRNRNRLNKMNNH